MVDDYQPTSVFADLKTIIGDKDYFILTSNADTHFELNGFDENKLWEVEGTFWGKEPNSAEWKQKQHSYESFVQKGSCNWNWESGRTIRC